MSGQEAKGPTLASRLRLRPRRGRSLPRHRAAGPCRRRSASSTKNVGEPNVPRSTERCVFARSSSFTSCALRQRQKLIGVEVAIRPAPPAAPPDRPASSAPTTCGDRSRRHTVRNTPSRWAATAARISTSVLTGKNGLAAERRDAVPLDEALGLQLFVFRLVLDARQTLRRRAVAGEFEHPAQQDGNILEHRARPPLDLRNHQMAEVSIRAAEIEVEFNLGHDITISRRRDGFPVRTSTRHAAVDTAANTPPRPPRAASAGWGPG